MQGRFKRDGSAAAEQEPRGGTDRGSSPQHTQNPGPAASGEGGDRAARAGTKPGAAEPEASPAPQGAPDTGSRIALRNWRISTRLVSLLALPVVAATTLGGIRINESMNAMEQLDHMQLLTKLTKEATNLAQALQEERDQTAGPLANGASASDSLKVSERHKTSDRAQKAFLQATEEIGETQGNEALQSIRSNVTQIAMQVVDLGAIRTDAYKKGTQHSQTIERYSRLIESLLSLSQDMAQATSNSDMIKRTRALAAFSSAKEYASIQRAIIAAALPTTDREQGDLNPNDRLYGLNARNNENAEIKSFQAIYASVGGDATELLAPLNSGNPSITAADKYADRVLSDDSGMEKQPPRGYLDWTDEDDTKIQAMNTIEATLLGEMEGKARDLRQESQRDAIINGALILLVLGVSLVGAFVVSRSMIRSLRRLQDTATRVAQDRLPELVKQLSEADPQDVDTSVESVGVHSRDEIGQVAAAFDDVHREAVRLASEQALLRGNVNAMFTNLSRRSQGLIQRQLSLISELESREADPDQLSSLFKLDHLATRMRRNGENLLVLAGEEPGRRWTRPVPLVDVLRAAASEVEQYERIELSSVPATEVAGRVVNDLVHLLAELLENATSFSSPQTKVRVTGHALPDGRVLVEIHDTGIGLSPEDLAAINERLASPPTVDVSVSRRMGLFVVGRLSLRHGIRIQLRPSDSGGTTALVMLPVDVAQGGKKAPGKPGPGGQGAMPQGPSGSGGRLTGGPGAAGGGRPGLTGGPGGARGQVGAGSGPRAALPGRNDAAGRPNGLMGGGQQGRQGQGGPQAQDPQRQSGGLQDAGLQGAFGGSGGRPQQGGPGAPGNGAPGSGIPTRSDVWQNGPAEQGGQNGRTGQGGQGGQNGRPVPPQQGNQPPQRGQHQQLPPSGGARPELPGGTRQPQRPQRPGTTSWGNDQSPVPPQQHTPLDAPRGHEEHEATGQYARPDLTGPQPGAQDPASTAQFSRPDFGAPQPPAPRRGGRDGSADFGAPRPPAAGLPQQQPEALPPAPGTGDGRTPLYDTLETNWFHGSQEGQQGQGQPDQVQQNQAQQQSGGQGRGAQGAQNPYPRHDQTVPNPVVPQSGAPSPTRSGQGGDAASTTGSWRTSPNDELVRQAERVRKPAAGGITTSGLPKRVPRANLVPGTAQEQNHQSGPQVSRAPDDVRGRLTNLRRGIQQGRQAGNSATGSFNIGPNHQQER
ncbi:sensor histidine kinase [Streptomyces sp. SP18CS02]|uniref:sensor histidine kinase n=1 Tax=Streptomyces sp. SP18CS02 TaxID=3002531 RepID=UPI002E762D5F|nr:nitrate- and nitrite sensing domain-containing protein [Streptomyces sp. SP18CS02]MEE1756994.1 nitrate- and nitrite sensing domain-containing protein [Streptomyces sp. SP18CS02]